MVFMLGSVIEEHTFLTKDVLPMGSVSNSVSGLSPQTS